MDGVGQWLGIIGGLVGLIVFLGTVVVYLRGSRDKGTITTLTNSNAALMERVGLLEANEARLSARVSLLEAENAALLAQRPSAEAIAALMLKLEAHDVATLRRLERLDTESKALWAKHDKDMKGLHAGLRAIVATTERDKP